jgi:hypothetical protein
MGIYNKPKVVCSSTCVSMGSDDKWLNVAKLKEKIAALPNGGVLLLENVRFIEWLLEKVRHFAYGRWYDLDPLQGSKPLKVGASLINLKVGQSHWAC